MKTLLFIIILCVAGYYYYSYFIAEKETKNNKSNITSNIIKSVESSVISEHKIEPVRAEPNIMEEQRITEEVRKKSKKN